ncbi:signal recognition particle-docking protein FtsY [uncultured Maritalea sp.]|uniref:signal recognition particle-docking protein FtsY n=1 Tax=uncultured Maritalea sp. TaxID=757249 RepID=UPI0026253145|nr:signal recognition particle-docking protein FtsY [uncultured Maritalea sp.]
MSEKKPGLFGRLFGKKAVPAEEAPTEAVSDAVESSSAEEITVEKTVALEPEAASIAPEPEGAIAPPTIDAVDDEPKVDTEPQPEEKKGWFQRLTSGLKKSSDQLTDNIAAVFTKKKLDDETLEQLEDVLIQADLGIETAVDITEKLAKDRFDKEISVDEIRQVLRDEVANVLAPVALPLVFDGGHRPHVILMVGVNGSGKTTTIGKLTAKLTKEGKKVVLAAGDTFRAAAVEQLQVWGERSGVEVITRPTGADASGLAFDAVSEAKAQGADVLIIDTAGRLQNRDELMAELEKIIRVIKKIDASAPHTTLLTLDATTGQNALNQVEIFGQRAGVTGLVMTKLDGTARGGILVAIAKKFKLPVHFIGVGESIGDLEPFQAQDFAEAIAGASDVT